MTSLSSHHVWPWERWILHPERAVKRVESAVDPRVLLVVGLAAVLLASDSGRTHKVVAPGRRKFMPMNKISRVH